MAHLDNQATEFYFDGFTKIGVKNTALLSDLLENLRAMHVANLQEHKDFVCSYKDTYDLKSDADLNELLVKFLFDQSIPEQIRALTGRNYVLGDLVLRKSKQVKSYMPWHRDTYLDINRNLVGRTPPLIKLIFYPQLENSRSHELSVLKGSSKRVFRNYLIDKLQRYFFSPTKVFQSNEECILFDSSIIHSAVPSAKNSNGSFRLIFNFCAQSQLDSFNTGTRISDIYRKYELSS